MRNDAVNNDFIIHVYDRNNYIFFFFDCMHYIPK